MKKDKKKEHKEKKILTITDIINLSRQHMNSFKKENINLSSYESEDTDILNNHLTICIIILCLFVLSAISYLLTSYFLMSNCLASYYLMYCQCIVVCPILNTYVLLALL